MTEKDLEYLMSTDAVLYWDFHLSLSDIARMEASGEMDDFIASHLDDARQFAEHSGKSAYDVWWERNTAKYREEFGEKYSDMSREYEPRRGMKLLRCL